MFKATRPVAKNEEICYNYGPGPYPWRTKVIIINYFRSYIDLDSVEGVQRSFLVLVDGYVWVWILFLLLVTEVGLVFFYDSDDSSVNVKFLCLCI